MKPARIAQKVHKWLGLVVGIQLVIWSVSGFYMVVVKLDVIHGNHLVQSPAVLDRTNLVDYSNSLTRVYKANPNATKIALRQMGNRATIEKTEAGDVQLYDAHTATWLDKLTESQIRSLAASYYNKKGPISASILITQDAPSEIGSRPLPIWRVDFDDPWGTTLYLSPNTGELVTRRHTLWRIFDFFWMLHIMDYDERSDINNWLMRIISIFAFLLVVSGGWYLYFRLRHSFSLKLGANART